jgi:hypothetical protein
MIQEKWLTGAEWIPRSTEIYVNYGIQTRVNDENNRICRLVNARMYSVGI